MSWMHLLGKKKNDEHKVSRQFWNNRASVCVCVVRPADWCGLIPSGIRCRHVGPLWMWRDRAGGRQGMRVVYICQLKDDINLGQGVWSVKRLVSRKNLLSVWPPPSYAHTPAYQRCAVVRWCNPLLVWSSTWHGTSNFFLADMCVYVRMRIDGWVRLQLRHASGVVTVALCMREGLHSQEQQEIDSRLHERGYPFLGLRYTPVQNCLRTAASGISTFSGRLLLLLYSHPTHSVLLKCT